MIPYIINVALILAGCLAFHKLLLQKETFYKTNRYVLVICIAISFLLPLLQIPKEFSFRKSESTNTTTNVLPETIVNNAPAQLIEQPSIPKTSEAVDSSFNMEKLLTWMFWLYWFGVIAFAINFLLQLLILLLRANLNPVIRDGRYRIVELNGDRAPCSFGNTIFINPEKYDWDTYCQILEHEKIHVRQGHSFDIILAEIMLVFQWFNPFAWIYRKEIESNLEFLTDDQLVQKNTVEKSSYQLSLLKVSTPHFPLSLTTNYNQSLLKKRIVMMNSKRSNVHTAWKYLFLLPMFVIFASLLNEHVASAQSVNPKKQTVDHKKGLETEGSWFATIKDDKVQFQFKQDDEENSYNGSTFLVSDFTSLPRGTAGTFKLTREAGTMEFTGKFENDQGMGRYKFVADKSYGQQMSKEVGETLDDRDMMVFFFVNIKKSYVQMLKSEGYTVIEKNELIPLAALNIESSFIRLLKENGYKNVTLQELIPLKSLGIDGTYIKDIRSAGYSNISVNDLISFKAQGIDKTYLNKVNAANAKNDKNKDQILDSHDVVAMKALNVDDEFINSFKAVGLTNISNNDLVSMKGVGVTPEYVKSFIDMGYKDINPADLIPLKAQQVTTEYIKSFETVGFKNIALQQVISVKALGITPEYIKSMKEKGFNYDRIDKYVTLKSID